MKISFAVDLCLIAILAGVSIIGHGGGNERMIGGKYRDSVESAVTLVLVNLRKDGSGKISRQRFIEIVEAEFDRLDRDRDGTVDPAELRRSLAGH